MSTDGYLISAVHRTLYNDHGLVAWHSSACDRPLQNETGEGNLEAVLLWKAVPAPGQMGREYPAGTLSFLRQGIDTEFSTPVYVNNMWRVADGLGISYNWNATAARRPEAAAWLKGEGPMPDLAALSGPPVGEPESGLTIGMAPGRLLPGMRKRRRIAQEALGKKLGADWKLVRGRFQGPHGLVIQVTSYYFPPSTYRVCFGPGLYVRVPSYKALKVLLARLGAPIA